MNPDRISIVVADWSTQRAEIEQLRRQVFIQEQQVPTDEEWDGQDEQAVHFLAISDAGEPVATARLLPEGKITRMAVAAPWRRQGIGSALLAFVEDIAVQRGIITARLDAQRHAVGFYQKRGYTAYGSGFVDAGIDHIRMEKILADPHTVLRFQYGSEALSFMRHFTDSASRSVYILSQQLGSGLYAEEQVVENLSALARRSANSTIRILVRDSKPLQAGGHPLVHLTQRLPSRMQIRCLKDDAPAPEADFLCVDGSDLVQFSDEHVPAGFALRGARAESRKLLEAFTYAWDYGSRDDPNLRQIHL